MVTKATPVLHHVDRVTVLATEVAAEAVVVVATVLVTPVVGNYDGIKYLCVLNGSQRWLSFLLSRRTRNDITKDA